LSPAIRGGIKPFHLPGLLRKPINDSGVPHEAVLLASSDFDYLPLRRRVHFYPSGVCVMSSSSVFMPRDISP